KDLSAKDIEVSKTSYVITPNKKLTSESIDTRHAYWCCAYGAGRRVGIASFSEPGTGRYEDDDPTATLFSDRAELRNPEEWLLRLDYAKKSRKQEEEPQDRLRQAKDLLISIMPDDEITDIRLTS